MITAAVVYAPCVLTCYPPSARLPATHTHTGSRRRCPLDSTTSHLGLTRLYLNDLPAVSAPPHTTHLPPHHCCCICTVCSMSADAGNSSAGKAPHPRLAGGVTAALSSRLVSCRRLCTRACCAPSWWASSSWTSRTRRLRRGSPSITAASPPTPTRSGPWLSQCASSATTARSTLSRCPPPRLLLARMQSCVLTAAVHTEILCTAAPRGASDRFRAGSPEAARLPPTLRPVGRSASGCRQQASAVVLVMRGAAVRCSAIPEAVASTPCTARHSPTAPQGAATMSLPAALSTGGSAAHCDARLHQAAAGG